VTQAYRIGRGLAGASRATSFIVVTIAYLLGGLAAWAVVVWGDGLHPLAVTLLADVIATLAVFAVSMAVANSSLYDPYWSVAPPVIVLAWLGDGVPARQALVVTLILIWAVRLTANWAYSWTGLGHEDWRYVQIRDQTRGRVPWWLVSLTGIQVMPTLVVFAGLLGVWPAVAVPGRALNPLDALAVLVTAAAITVETVADLQLRRFTGDPANRGKVAEVGLWRYSRHPNYVGEIGFWWGMWLFGLAAAPGWWWTVVGPVVMLALFAFVSVPLMDRRSLVRRPAYAEYAQRVSALVPIPRPRAGR